MIQSSDAVLIVVTHAGGPHGEELLSALMNCPEITGLSTRDHGRRLVVSTQKLLDRAEEAVRRQTGIARKVLLARDAAGSSSEVRVARAGGFAAAENRK